MDKTLFQRASLIKLLITDCDGVLTDGGVYYSAVGEAFKRFNIRDGMGIERLREIAGTDVVIISGEQSPALKQRAAKLAISDLFLGIKNKKPVAITLAESRGYKLNQIAYIGDDVNDLPLLSIVGFAACPKDAFQQVKSICHYVCASKGGHGAFREVAEILLAAQAKPYSDQ